jgi:conjugative transposon TraM protein
MESTAAAPSTGLNYQLPDAKLDNTSPLDKLSFYALAKQDSLKRLELEQLDPLYEKESTREEQTSFDREYQPIYQSKAITSQNLYQEKSSAELDQLQTLVQSLQQPQKDADLEQLNQTLQQLVALQQPSTPHAIKANASEVYAVQSSRPHTTIGFYGESTLHNDTGSADLISARVHGEQQVQHGSILKLRLCEDVLIRDEKIPAGRFVFGQVSLEQERLQIIIRSISCNGQLYPVSLSVFDLDGIAGIHIPSSVEREVVKQSAEQAVQSVGLPSVIHSLPAQIASAGIGTAKNLLGRKLRQVRVNIKSGYQVFLRDEKGR